MSAKLDIYLLTTQSSMRVNQDCILTLTLIYFTSVFIYAMKLRHIKRLYMATGYIHFRLNADSRSKKRKRKTLVLRKAIAAHIGRFTDWSWTWNIYILFEAQSSPLKRNSWILKALSSFVSDYKLRVHNSTWLGFRFCFVTLPRDCSCLLACRCIYILTHAIQTRSTGWFIFILTINGCVWSDLNWD